VRWCVAEERGPRRQGLRFCDATPAVARAPPTHIPAMIHVDRLNLHLHTQPRLHQLSTCSCAVIGHACSTAVEQQHHRLSYPCSRRLGVCAHVWRGFDRIVASSNTTPTPHLLAEPSIPNATSRPSFILLCDLPRCFYIGVERRCNKRSWFLLSIVFRLHPSYRCHRTAAASDSDLLLLLNPANFISVTRPTALQSSELCRFLNTLGVLTPYSCRALGTGFLGLWGLGMTLRWQDGSQTKHTALKVNLRSLHLSVRRRALS
jgi:hypothetical protein